MSDDLRERIADLRVMRRNSYGPPGDVVAAANLAPTLADAYDAAQATIAERDAEIARLKEALEQLKADTAFAVEYLKKTQEDTKRRAAFLATLPE